MNSGGGMEATMPVFLLMLCAVAVLGVKRPKAPGTLLLFSAPLLYTGLVAGMALPWPLPLVVELLGLHVLTLTAGLAVAGWVIRAGPPRWLQADPRIMGIAGLALLTTAAVLGLLRPGWSLADVSLAEVSAGGRLGAFLTGSVPGIIAWTAATLVLVRLTWPRSVFAASEGIADVTSRLGSWSQRGSAAVYAAASQRDVSGSVSPRMPRVLQPVQAWFGAGESLRPANRRVEGVGVGLLMAASALGVLLLAESSLPQPLAGLTTFFGLQVFLLVPLLAGAGLLVWTRSLDILPRMSRDLVCAPLAVIVGAGVLGLARPAWLIGDVSLAEVTAGGSLGAYLVGTLLGTAFWLATLLALIAVAWPSGVQRLRQWTPVAFQASKKASAVGAKKTWQGTTAAVKMACPIEPPPDERPGGVEEVPGYLRNDAEDDTSFGLEQEEWLEEEPEPPSWPEWRAVQHFDQQGDSEVEMAERPQT